MRLIRRAGARLWLAPRRPGRWRCRNRPRRTSPAARDTAVVHHRSCTTCAGLVVGGGFSGWQLVV